MMISEILKHEIDRFLASKEPEVLCIHGHWGVGKTFAWKKYLREAATSSRVNLTSYSYVSLFGVSSLSDVKKEIFRNTVDISAIGDLPDERSMVGQISSVLESSKSHISSIGSLFGGKGAALAGLIEELSFAAIKGRLICFDDLERAGKGLEVKDVLGLASSLKEERGCKVVVLLNDEKIEGDGRDQFQIQFEKLFDSHVKFNPTPLESVQIAVKEEEPYYDALSSVVTKLGLNNIRIIRKIERALQQVSRVPGLPEDALHQTIWAASIASWSRYRPDEAIPMSELETYNSYSWAFQRHDNKDAVSPRWYDKLQSTGYSGTDPFDRAVIRCVVDGFANPTELLETWKATEAERRVPRENPAYKEAWEAFHASTTLSDDEIANRLAAAVKSDPGSITISSMSSTATFLRDIGKSPLADELIDYFFTERKFLPSDLDNDVFAGRFEKIDPRIKAYFEGLKTEYVDERDPKDVLQKIAVHESWSPKDIQLLSRLDGQALVDVIDSLQGEHLRDVLKMCGRFFRTKDNEYIAFRETLEDAFRLLVARSKNNEVKLALLGIRLNDTNTE